jgi:hypothetical protein
MKRISLLAFLLSLSAALTPAVAGEIEAAAGVTSAEFTQFQDRRESAHVTLSPTQLHDLTLWLEQHHAHWRGMATDATSEPTALLLSLRHADGGTSTLSVKARRGGGYYLMLTGPGRWAYRSLGGLYKSWAATRSLSDPDFAALRELLGAH